MNILQLNNNIKKIDNFIKNDNIKLIFMNNIINGSKINITKKLKKLVDLKYGNYNVINIDNENNIYIYFKDDININILIKLLYYYNLIKLYIIKISKNKNKKNLIYELIIIISYFYYNLIEINKLDEKNKNKIINKINNIYLLYHFKYLLSDDEKKILNLDYKKIYKYYKKKYKIKGYKINNNKLLKIKYILINNKKIFDVDLSNIDYIFHFLKINIEIGNYKTNCMCLRKIINSMNDENFILYLMKKLKNYENKKLSLIN